ncbi:MAG: glycosyltransferase family 4 protein, partial [Chlamydiales bacterium]|nr:glycosyltransferase family 4 protein [Chlamydiales bacterium]
VKNQILNLYEIDPQKIEVVHNGVEWSLMQNDFDNWEERREKVLAEYHLDPQKYQLLFIGNNYRRKGLENLLKALSLVSQQTFQLLIIGKDKNVRYFRQMAEALQLSSSVRFLGQDPDIRKFYQMADALIIPSSYDPFANVTVEALAMGLYVISSSQNGGHEVLTPSSGSLIEPSHAPQNIALALEKALSYPKTPSSSVQIRNSVAHLDFPHQIHLIIHSTLGYNPT